MVQNDISLLQSNTLHYFLQSYPYVSELLYLCATLFNLMLLRICLYLFLLFLPANYTTTRSSSPLIPADPAAAMSSVCRQLYADMQLDSMVDYTAFEQAITGAQAIERRNKDIITLIDFTKPSTEERLYVLDIRHKRLLFSSLVSHGKNSGGNYATSFSNKVNSYKSSLGFFVTENTYQGKNGYSLVLNGLEKGINDRAKERAIVVHGANYCSPSVAVSTGRLGRSFGCPALPPSLAKPIINTIKDGTLLYIYANDKEYLSQSTILSTGRSISPNSIIALNSLIRE